MRNIFKTTLITIKIMKVNYLDVFMTNLNSSIILFSNRGFINSFLGFSLLLYFLNFLDSNL